jgi:hypothetical protein
MSLYRKIIHISAEDSPNVKKAQEQIDRGEEPTNEIVIPGVLPYETYKIRMTVWDEMRKCISLAGRFWEGKEVMMFPSQWFSLCLRKAIELRGIGKKRYGLALSCDPGEGVANTAWCALDDLGIMEMQSFPTEDTTDIPGRTIAIGNFNNVDPENWVLDRGGGGKQAADQLRRLGYPVTTIAFGEPPSTEPKHGIYTVYQRLNIREEKSAYINKRAQMYYEARMLLDPSINPDGFGIPGGEPYKELIRQLSLIPLKYDQHGRIYVPPKNRKPGTSTIKGQPTLTEIIGNSPDEADAFVMAVHRMLHGELVMSAGTFDNSTNMEEDLISGARVSMRREQEKLKKNNK